MISGFKEISLYEVISDAIELYSPIAESKQITFNTNIDADEELINHNYGDKDLLFQAFANVIDNAIKFTPAQGAIDINVFVQHRKVVFTIDDTGVGVDDASISKLTRRFYREDKSRTSCGNGLGLSLVNAIVALHGGKISFEKSQIAAEQKSKNGLRCIILL